MKINEMTWYERKALAALITEWLGHYENAKRWPGWDSEHAAKIANVLTYGTAEGRTE
jgi:hypothetical protein